MPAPALMLHSPVLKRYRLLIVSDEIGVELLQYSSLIRRAPCSLKRLIAEGMRDRGTLLPLRARRHTLALNVPTAQLVDATQPAGYDFYDPRTGRTPPIPPLGDRLIDLSLSCAAGFFVSA